VEGRETCLHQGMWPLAQDLGGEARAYWCPDCGAIAFPPAKGVVTPLLTWISPKLRGTEPLSRSASAPEHAARETPSPAPPGAHPGESNAITDTCCQACGDGHKHCKTCGAYVRGTHIDFCSPKCERAGGVA
jgi:hypothetical protein